MKLQKIIISTLNYFTSKFYLEHNLSHAEAFEKLQNTWTTVLSTIETKNMSKSKKDFGSFITETKILKLLLENRTDISLYNSLLSLLFMVRRTSNKEKSFYNVLNKDLKDCINHPEFGKSKLLNTNKIISVKFPKNI